MLTGKTLGKHRITEHLGSGGMAEVYKAYQPGLDRYVAIKALHSFLATEEDFLTRFQREAKVVAMLRHPNIIQVYDFDYDEEFNVYHMVMEFIDGPTLKEHLLKLAEEKRGVPIEEAVHIVLSIANALDYAHQRGMVHRDIKPANVMFNEDNQVILTDFGIAKMVDMAGLTASGAMVGTPAYMAPEQGMGQAGDERSDIYSLGVVLYELVTGQLPFDADTFMGVVLKHINEPLTPPSAVNSNVPPEIERVVMKALAKEPTERYQTAQAFAADLSQALTALPEQVKRGQPTLIGPRSRPQSTAQSTSQGWERATLPTAPAYGGTPPPSGANGLSRPWLVVIGAALGVIVLASLLLLATGTGNRLLAALVPPEETSAPLTVTATPDTVETQIAAALATYVATTGVTPTPSNTPTTTPSPTPTPDATATALAACVFDVEVTSDRPIWPSILTPGQQFVKRWEIENVGTCPLPEGTTLVQTSGDESEIVEEPVLEALQPEEEATLEMTLRAPRGYATYVSRWQLETADGQPIGEPMEIRYRVDRTPTPRPTPLPTATSTPTATVTPAVPPTPSEPLHFSVPVVVSCQDQPGGTWIGQIGLTAWGGTGEYQYYVNEISSETEFFNGTFEIEWQQGKNWQGTVIVVSGEEVERWKGAIPYPGDC
jgi:serine/threonine-protein kinase